MTAPAPDAFVRLAGLYAALPPAFPPSADVSCRACGQCCHFDVFGHVVYASRLEVDYLSRHAPMPAGDPPLGRCPYQSSQACAAHFWRPLGCRAYYCSLRAADEAVGAMVESWHGALKKLHDELELEWDYRPMLELLAEKSWKCRQEGV